MWRTGDQLEKKREQKGNGALYGLQGSGGHPPDADEQLKWSEFKDECYEAQQSKQTTCMQHQKLELMPIVHLFDIII